MSAQRPYMDREMRALAWVTGFCVLSLIGLLVALPWLW